MLMEDWVGANRSNDDLNATKILVRSFTFKAYSGTSSAVSVDTQSFMHMW